MNWLWLIGALLGLITLGVFYVVHRDTRKALHRRSAQSAGYGAGATLTSAQQAYVAHQSALALRNYPGPYPGLIQMGAMGTAGGAGLALAPQPQMRELEHEGIRAGEVIAWRAWRFLLSDGRLHSVAMDCEWHPHKPMRGHVTSLGPEGVYAFKERDTLEDEKGIRTMTSADWGIAIVGQVALWGEVVEHEAGYRAEYAYPLSFEAVYSSTMPASHVKAHLERLYLPQGGSACNSTTNGDT